MGTIDPRSTVSATGIVVEKTPTTPAEAIQNWLDQQPDTFDLGQITRGQTVDLIEYLEQENQESTSPELSTLIENLESKLTQFSGSNSMPLAQFEINLKLQLAVLNTLKAELPASQQTTLSERINSLQAMINETDLILQGVFADPGRWSNDPSVLTQQVQGMIDRIETFTAGQPAGESFGLNGLAAKLQNALNAYELAMTTVTDPNSVEGKLALSNLREAFHSAKANYLEVSGVSRNNAELAGANAGMRSEQLRQTSLLAPTEDTTASPQAVSATEIDTALRDLRLQYELAVSEGDQDAMALIQSKMEILVPLKARLLDGEDPLLVGIVMFHQLRFVDLSFAKVSQARLRQEAADLQRRNDPNTEEQIAELTSQADSFDAKIDALNKQITQVQNQYETVLTTWAQTLNESLSKAL